MLRRMQALALTGFVGTIVAIGLLVGGGISASAATERPEAAGVPLAQASTTILLTSQGTTIDSGSSCTWATTGRTSKSYTPIYDYVSNPSFPPVIIGYRVDVYRELTLEGTFCLHKLTVWDYWYSYTI